MKRLLKVGMVLLTLGALVGCGSSGVKEMSGDMGSKVEVKSDKVIELYNEGNFKEIYSMASEQLKANITEEKLQEAGDGLLKNIGQFKEEKERQLGEKDGLYLCVTLGEFDKGQAQVQTSFNKDLQLEGFAIVK